MLIKCHLGECDMKSVIQKKFLHVTGKALKKKDQWLAYDLGIMMDAARLHLKMLGMLHIKELLPHTKPVPNRNEIRSRAA